MQKLVGKVVGGAGSLATLEAPTVAKPLGCGRIAKSTCIPVFLAGSRRGAEQLLDYGAPWWKM